jgi:hypothetical protein
MDEDELIFLGAAILLSQKGHEPLSLKGHEPDATAIQTAVDSAFKLHEEVKKQLSERRANQPLALVELAKEKLEGGS